jgi:hypothetical protein
MTAFKLFSLQVRKVLVIFIELFSDCFIETNRVRYGKNPDNYLDKVCVVMLNVYAILAELYLVVFCANSK